MLSATAISIFQERYAVGGGDKLEDLNLIKKGPFSVRIEVQ